MRILINLKRTLRLINSAIDSFELNLRGLTVLTEAASGPFSVTPVIAAMAGADRVIAVGRDSMWGPYNEVVEHIKLLAHPTGNLSRIEFSNKAAINFASSSNVVTNLGFVRPIDSNFVNHLPSDSAIALMWEPWEFRPGEVDVEACRLRKIPILGTNESHSKLKIFNYLGLVAQRLLFEREIEVLRSKIILIASEPFLTPIEQSLISSGAEVLRVEPFRESDWLEKIMHKLANIDAIILAEHRSKELLVGKAAIPPDLIAKHGIELIHICGLVEDQELSYHSVIKHPSRKVPTGFMTVTTDYIGPRPVIDLHTAGLAIGANLVKSLRAGKTDLQARQAEILSGIGVDFDK
jgi:hypothetical protein